MRMRSMRQKNGRSESFTFEYSKSHWPINTWRFFKSSSHVGKSASNCSMVNVIDMLNELFGDAIGELVGVGERCSSGEGIVSGDCELFECSVSEFLRLGGGE